jgi:hypothetical protein
LAPELLVEEALTVACQMGAMEAPEARAQAERAAAAPKHHFPAAMELMGAMDSS